MASLTNKEIADLHRQCMAELREGGSEATQKMLEFWGIQDYLRTDEFFHRVQLMLEQESYYERFDYGQTSILKRDDDDIGYRLGQYRSDFRTYVDQIMQEMARQPVQYVEIQNDLQKYNGLRQQNNSESIAFQSPTENQSQKIEADSYWCKPPYIYHAVSGDFESVRLEDETQSKYAERTDVYFANVLRSALSQQVPLIHITPEQVANICQAPSNNDLKRKDEINKKIETLRQENATKKQAIPQQQEKQKSKLAQFLERFASKSIQVDRKDHDVSNGEMQKVSKPKLHNQRKPIDVCKIQPGIEIVIPSGCKNITNGQELPEIKAEVLSVWQEGGQMMVSTTAGILTTRDMSIDLHKELQERITRLEYEIAHAAEIAAQKAAETERINYKLHWFDKIESKIPELPRDDRLDMDDMTYFGYTPELYSQSAAERDRDYQNGMEKFKQKSQVFAQELVQRCLRENIRMIYAGDHWTNFEYYGQTPDDFSPPDFRYNQVPKRYEDEVYLPSTCTDAITGEKLEYNANKMHDIWDIVASGINSNTSFALIGENVNGEIVLVTSIDIRDMARELSKSISMETQEIELENLEQVEPDISDKR